MAATGFMGAEYTIHALSASGTILPANPYRRYFAVFSDADATIQFGENTTDLLFLPAGMPFAPVTSPTNKLTIKSGGAGLIMEA